MLILKIEAENRKQFEKRLQEEIKNLEKNKEKEMLNDVQSLSCLLSTMLQKCKTSKVFLSN